jgi:tRNA nucleotidyltransferase (CCA-adding enzyme)
MKLPGYVETRLRRLEDRGYETWVVGGCVRDALLGLEPQDYDLCTAALPERIKEVFSDHGLVLAGEKHGTVTVLTEGGPLEITTYRLEGDYADSRRPGWVRFVEDVDLDLSRRDFTVNAMAFSPDRGLRDPFGGRQDLEKKCLRAVGDPAVRFSEDALRILRGLRFSARYGLEPESATLEAMKDLAPLLERLARERVFDELCKLLRLAKAEDLLRFAPILAQAIPELEPMLGFAQHTPHHAYDVFTHTAWVVEGVPARLPMRWAALLHDVGKPACFTLDENGRGHFLGHASVSADMADEILRRLKAPTALRSRVVELIRTHMTPLTADRKLLRRRLCQYGPEGVREMLDFQKADFGGKGVAEPYPFGPVEALLEEVLAEASCLGLKDLAVNGKDLMALGYPAGKELGACLNRLLEMVLEEKIPNEKEILLRQALEMR